MFQQFRTWYAMQPPAIRLLWTINVVAYLVWQLVLRHIDVTAVFVRDHLMLHPDPGVLLFEPWQVLTYAFLHLSPGMGGLLHILFNMLWLVWIGRDFEQMQGSARLFAIYVLSSVGGALLTVLLHVLFPDSAMLGALVHGASGGVLGVMAAVAMLYPHQRIGLLFIGSVRLMHVVIGFLFLDLLFFSASGTAVFAHLGGVLAGFGFALAQQRGVDLSGWAVPLFASRGRRGGRTTGGQNSILDRAEGWLSRRTERSAPSSSPGPLRSQGGSPLRRVPRPSGSEASEPAPEADDVSADVDRILDKISEKGYDALTAEEKRTLYEASQK